MKDYFDKNNTKIQDEDYILVDEKVCQALRCEDNTLLYEELYYSNNRLDLADNPKYPDFYNNKEVEIINYEKAIHHLSKSQLK